MTATNIEPLKIEGSRDRFGLIAEKNNFGNIVIAAPIDGHFEISISPLEAVQLAQWLLKATENRR